MANVPTPAEQLAASRLLTARLHVALTDLHRFASAQLEGPAVDAGAAALSHSEPEHLALLNDIRQCARDSVSLAVAQKGGDPVYARRVLALLGEG